MLPSQSATGFAWFHNKFVVWLYPMESEANDANANPGTSNGGQLPHVRFVGQRRPRPTPVRDISRRHLGLRREVERLRRACADNGLYAVSILYPSLAVEWHDPRSEFRIESDRLVVNRMGDVRWEGRTRFAGNRMATEYTAFSTLTALAESGELTAYQTEDVKGGVEDAVLEAVEGKLGAGQ
ncbi:hypothetical protein [Cupriavidus sp. H39]|uniref:hypothetical protein n=1 Tax=Cupriavidus sp. H39 TaxID=3401635 RepID=UPI003D047C0B